MKGWIILLFIVSFLGFSVYAYKVRTNYNIDKQNRKIWELKENIEILSYAISIFPEKNKNEVFFNSIKEKFPEIEEKEEIIKILGIKIEKEEKEIIKNNEEKEKLTVMKVIDHFAK